MLKFKEQYGWNLFFTIIFISVLVYIIPFINKVGYQSVSDLGLLDMVLIVGATWRLVRLFARDVITAFLREQFFDEAPDGTFNKPAKGLRRTIADLLSCPWCLSIWIGLVVIVCYLTMPFAILIALILTISALATFLQHSSEALVAFAKGYKK